VSLDSSVSVMTGYGMDDRGPISGRAFWLPPLPRPVDTGDYFPRDNADGM
jgi:hypothetical protein